MTTSIDLPPPTLSGFGQFYETQFRTKPKPPPPGTTLASKTVVITGSNVGIGLEASLLFLELKVSHLILGVRSIETGEKAAAQLRRSHPAAVIQVWHLDMLSYPSIQAFAKRCLEELPRLDIALLNAASGPASFRLSPQGHEETFQVNYISTALLAILLLPALKPKTPGREPGHLCLVSSGLALRADLHAPDDVSVFAALDDKKNWNYGRYATTKTLVLMVTYMLSQKVDRKDVIVSAVDPGFTGGSKLHREMPLLIKGTLKLLEAATARTLRQAAWQYADAVAVRGAETHGCFVMNWQIYPFHAMMYTPEGKRTMARLWEETMTEFEFAGAKGIVESFAGM